MEVNIVGSEGNFGSFLYRELSLQSAMPINLSNDADIVIMAVPLEAYEEVAKAHSGKHLVNICSVQKPSTDICLKYSDRVTSIHPMFGVRTPFQDRRFIYTYLNNSSVEIINLFKLIHGSSFFTSDPVTHDKYMAKTHLQVVLLHDQIKGIMEGAKEVPDEFLTPSFLRLKALSEQYLDMPKGTKDSILANPYRE